MEETVQFSPAASKAPTAVVVIAVLNYISAVICALAVLAGLALALFGSTMSANTQKLITDAMTQAAASTAQTTAISQNILTMVGVLMAVIFAALGALSFFIARGLIKGVKWTWYVQIAFSVLGLLSFPLGTIINGIVLFFFFQPVTRAHFKV